MTRKLLLFAFTVLGLMTAASAHPIEGTTARRIALPREVAMNKHKQRRRSLDKTDDDSDDKSGKGGKGGKSVKEEGTGKGKGGKGKKSIAPSSVPSSVPFFTDEDPSVEQTGEQPGNGGGSGMQQPTKSPTPPLPTSSPTRPPSSPPTQPTPSPNTETVTSGPAPVIPVGQSETTPSMSPKTPSPAPTTSPTTSPTDPVSVPSFSPMPSVSASPSQIPSWSFNPSTSISPSSSPMDSPTDVPTFKPSAFPSQEPSHSRPPTAYPTTAPSTRPPSSRPSEIPSLHPSETSSRPSEVLSLHPSETSSRPSDVPSLHPSASSSWPSAMPSLHPSTLSPSSFPTESASPTQTSNPSSTPAEQPSASPSGSARPSASPSASQEPTLSQRPTSSSQPSSNPIGEGIPFVLSRSGTIDQYSCELVVEPPGYSQVVFQRFNVQARLCPTDGTIPSDITSSLLSGTIVPELARRHLDCAYSQESEFVNVILDNSKSGTLTSVNDGTSCTFWVFPFQMDFMVRTTRRRRQLNVQEEIFNYEVADIVYSSLVDIFAEIDVIPITMEGFTNMGGAGADDPKVDSAADGVINSPGEARERKNVAVPVMAVGCSALAVLVIALFAVRRRQDRIKNEGNQHVMLKDVTMDVESENGQVERSSVSTSVILRDLDPNGMNHDDDDAFQDQDEAEGSRNDQISYYNDDGSRSTQYPKVYVVDGANDPEVSTQAEYDNLRYTCGAYELFTRPASMEAQPPAPTFVTADLRKAMKDLAPPSPPSNRARHYAHDDTIDL